MSASLAAPARKTRKGSAKRLTPEEAHELCQRYTAGETLKELAKAFGIHRRTVSSHLQNAGVPRRVSTRSMSSEDVRRAAVMYSDRNSLAKIGEHFGVHAKTVSIELRRIGVPIRRQGQNYR